MSAMALPLEHDAEVGVFQAVQAGDRFALEELISRHSRWVRGVVYAQLGDVHLTEDVVQQVWLRVWERAASLREPALWRAWLVRLARNVAYDELRARRQDREGLLGAARIRTRNSEEPGRPDETLAAEEEKRRVMEALQGLPAIYREPLVLKQLEGWTYQEIGDVLGLPADTVETRLVRARRLLRETLNRAATR